jgi:hypothetical protein
MMITSKSMAPIARRKKPKDGSGIDALPLFLLTFAIGLELQVGGLVPKLPNRTSQKARNAFPLRRVEPAMLPKGRRSSPSRRGYFDFFAASWATSRKSASSLCEEPNGLSKSGSGCFPRMSLPVSLALSATPCTLWSIARSFAAIPMSTTQARGPQFLR